MVSNDQLVYGPSKERLESLFDGGTFVELGAYTKRKTSEENYEGVVCGYGSVEGKLVFAFAQDSSRNKGAFDDRHAKKIADMYSLAVKNGAPIVGIFDSAGAVVYDGASALASYAKFMKCVSDASGIVPQIAMIDGICAGSSAVIASMFDMTVTIKDRSKLYVNSPFVIGDEVKKNDFATKCGNSVYCAEDASDAVNYTKKLLSLLPSNNAEGAFVSDVCDDLNRVVDLDTASYSAEKLVGDICDAGSFIRVYKDYAKSMIAGFGSVGGICTCILASDPEFDGVLDIKSARMCAKLISFCDGFKIPVVNLIDSIGLDVSLEAESESYSSELARLASAYASSETTKVSVIVGKAYGAAFALLGSKSLGADIAYALEGASVSVLSPEASVAFVWNDKVGEVSREELETEWKEKCASADQALEIGEIDDVIEPAEIRKRICAALSMLAFKAEGTPSRKHVTLPL